MYRRQSSYDPCGTYDTVPCHRAHVSIFFQDLNSFMMVVVIWDPKTDPRPTRLCTRNIKNFQNGRQNDIYFEPTHAKTLPIFPEGGVKVAWRGSTIVFRGGRVNTLAFLYNLVYYAVAHVSESQAIIAEYSVETFKSTNSVGSA